MVFGGLVEAVQETGNFNGAVAESGAESVRVGGLWPGVQLVLVAQSVQVADGELENVGLFQFGYVFSLLKN